MGWVNITSGTVGRHDIMVNICMSENGISTLPTKEEKQEAKLALAETKRQTAGNGYRTNNVLDIDLLPTKYSGNDIIINGSPLPPGRPWTDAPDVPDAPPIITSGLILSLDAANTSSYPGSGSTWTNLVDESTFTINNGTFDSTVGGCIDFNGTDTYVNLGSTFSGLSAFTKEAWVLRRNTVGNQNVLSSADTVFYWFQTQLNGGVGGSYSVVSTIESRVDTWMYISCTFDSTTDTMKLYVDNTLVATSTSATGVYAVGDVYVGCHITGGTPVSFLNGKIAQIRMYDVALSDAELTENYNATKAAFEV